MQPKFIKVKKANRSHDRGFIAVDAICSVFEDKERHVVSIMTMDGFWYEVEDDVEALFAIITGQDVQSSESQSSGKKEYYRRKKMLPPVVANEKAQVNHDIVCRDRSGNSEIEEVDIFRPRERKGKRRNFDISRTEKNLSAGADEGQYEPKPIGEGL